MLQIKTTTKTDSFINLQTPAYFKGMFSGCVLVTDNEMIRVMDSVISIWTPNEKCFDDTVIEAMRGETCTKEDFDGAMIAFLDRIGQYIPESVNL